MLGPICSFLAATSWAIGSSTYGQLAQRASPYAVNMGRAGFGLVLFLITGCLMQGTEFFHMLFHVETRTFVWCIISIIATYAVGDPIFLLSTRRIGVPAALCIASCFPVWTALGGSIFLHESLAYDQLLGLFVIVSGVIAVILLSYTQNDERKGIQWTGYFMALGSSMLWALNAYAMRHGATGLSLAASNVFRMSLALVISVGLHQVLFATGVEKGALFLSRVDIKRFWPIFCLEAYGGSFASIYGFAHSPIPLAAALSSLAPVISVPLAIFMKVEKFSWRKMLAVIWVVFGICLLMQVFS